MDNEEKLREHLENSIKKLLDELFIQSNEDKEIEIAKKIQEISPDPKILDYIFHSDDYINPDGSIDIKGLVDKIIETVIKSV